VPVLIGGPLCGKNIGRPATLPEAIEIEGGGVYRRLTNRPNWIPASLVFAEEVPVYLWEPIYRDVSSRRPEERPEETA